MSSELNPHPHRCLCGDFRICTKTCALTADGVSRQPWTCPDCEVTERLVDLERVEVQEVLALEQARLSQVNWVC